MATEKTPKKAEVKKDLGAEQMEELLNEIDGYQEKLMNADPKANVAEKANAATKNNAVEIKAEIEDVESEPEDELIEVEAPVDDDLDAEVLPEGSSDSENDDLMLGQDGDMLEELRSSAEETPMEETLGDLKEEEAAAPTIFDKTNDEKTSEIEAEAKEEGEELSEMYDELLEEDEKETQKMETEQNPEKEAKTCKTPKLSVVSENAEASDDSVNDIEDEIKELERDIQEIENSRKRDAPAKELKTEDIEDDFQELEEELKEIEEDYKVDEYDEPESHKEPESYNEPENYEEPENYKEPKRIKKAKPIKEYESKKTDSYDSTESDMDTLNMAISGRMKLKLAYSYSNEEVEIYFEDHSLYVGLSNGAEFRIPLSPSNVAKLRKAS